ncbi:hypothetical protein P9112_003938 [Eukaryota sp. TZLM1-RC]
MNDLSFLDVSIIDFDKPRICSSSYSHFNLSCCLHCGLFFSSGRESSPAYLHALSNDHEYFIDLTTGISSSVFTNKPVTSPYLDHLKQFLTFVPNHRYSTSLDSQSLDSLPYPTLFFDSVVKAKALDESVYIPGFVPLVSSNPFLFSSVCLLFCQIKPIRNVFFLYYSKISNFDDSNLLHQFAKLCVTLWNPFLIRPQISIDDCQSLFVKLIQSNGYSKSEIFNMSNPSQFLPLFISQILQNAPHSISKTFNCVKGRIKKKNVIDDVAKSQIFRFLTLTPPPLPLFKDVHKENQLPKVALYDLLSIYNGQRISIDDDQSRVVMTLDPVPKYLIISIDRFENDVLGVKKNITVLDFQLTCVDLSLMTSSDESCRFKTVFVISHSNDRFICFVNINNNWFGLDKSVYPVTEDQVLSSDCVLLFLERF